MPIVADNLLVERDVIYGRPDGAGSSDRDITR
jgi:hypothetical protein